MIRMIVPTLALIVFWSAAAGAEPATAAPATAAPHSADCASLEKKYDAADKSKVTADKLKKANAKRAEGAKQCAAGNTHDGEKYLKSALKLIGIKPSA